MKLTDIDRQELAKWKTLHCRNGQHPEFDAHTYAASGISADLEQQRRERCLPDRLPTRADWWQFAWYTAAVVVGVSILYALAAIIETALR